MDERERSAVIDTRRTLSPQWNEALSLLPGRLEDQGDTVQAQAALDRILLPRRPDPFHWRLLLGATAAAQCTGDPFSKTRRTVVNELARLLRSSARIDVSRAANALAQFGPEGVDTLASALMSDDPYRDSTVLTRALAQCGPQGRATTLAILEDPKERARLRWGGFEALAEVGAVEAVPILASLLEEALPGDNQSRQVAYLLAQLGEQGEAALIRCLPSGNPETVVQALHGLGRIGCRTSDSVLPFLEARDHGLRKAAVAALARGCGEESVRWLADIAADESFRVREAVARQARELGAAAPPLLARLAADEAPDVRHAVVETLSPRDESTAGILKALMEDEQPSIRSAACRTAGRWLKEQADDNGLAERLKHRLADADMGVRLAAAEAIGDGAEVAEVLNTSRDYHGLPDSDTKHATNTIVNHNLRSLASTLSLASRQYTDAYIRLLIVILRHVDQRPAFANTPFAKRVLASSGDGERALSISISGTTEERRLVAAALPMMPADTPTRIARLLLAGDPEPAVRRTAPDITQIDREFIDAIADWLSRSEHFHPPESWEAITKSLLQIDPGVAAAAMTALLTHDGVGDNLTQALYEQSLNLNLLLNSNEQDDDQLLERLTTMMAIDRPVRGVKSAQAIERRWRDALEAGLLPRVARNRIVSSLLDWPGREGEALKAAQEATSAWPGWTELNSEASAHWLCGDLRRAARSMRQAARAPEGYSRSLARGRAARIAMWRGAHSSAIELLAGLDSDPDHGRALWSARILSRLCACDPKQVEEAAAQGNHYGDRGWHSYGHYRILLAHMQNPTSGLAARLKKSIEQLRSRASRVAAANDIAAVLAAWSEEGQFVTRAESNELQLAVSRGCKAADAAWLAPNAR